MTEQPCTPRQFLDEVYKVLQYDEGALFDATLLPNEHSKNAWIDKGEWLSLASEIGAEKVFFVNNDPVIVFCTQKTTDEQEIIDLFRRYWCMARPQFLFFALPGELRVYSLNQEPVKNRADWQNRKPLSVIRRVADVLSKLRVYHREKVETGQLFQEKYFGDIQQRADKRLMQDLKLVRKALLETGLQPRYAHALIGRSIFIRYLEDRKIITFDYFAGVAANNPEWQEKLSTDQTRPVFSSYPQEHWYYRVLQDKAFTYALFEQLSLDFNGDMFPRDREEENSIEQSHLDLLRAFLLGDVYPGQPVLFLWAYDFEIVPTNLVSSIYEEFYHANNEDDKGTHYTHSVLVEHVLHEVLSDNNLAKKPRILDPACGSGIFLVESFRRIVRYQVQKTGKPLELTELRNILKTQIAGIEINTEAVHVAAFSLYLALLHYQEPRDIRKNPRLPRLIFRPGQSDNEDDFGILYNNDVFSLTKAEYEALTKKIQEQRKFKGRAELERFVNGSEILPMDNHTFNIVVGNPPWGESKGTSVQTQTGWCNAFGWPNGDEETSQAFIARALSFLKQGGNCGFLVSTGVFFKNQRLSEEFRTRWLEQVTLKKVINFVHVRHVFFNADSPFAFIHFERKKAPSGHKVQYWSAKRTEIVDQLQVIVLGLPDLKQIGQTELQRNPFLWKTYWWGNHRDAALINTLKLYQSLGDVLESREWGIPHRGFQGPRTTVENKPSDWLRDFKELPSRHFDRYGQISCSRLITVPDWVQHCGFRDVYEDWRILVKRTFGSNVNNNGIIVARLENARYCFRNSIHGFSVNKADEWERKVLIGLLWSSLARYYLFLISSGWGVYHYEIKLHEIMSIPIRFPENLGLRNRIVEIVDTLIAWEDNDFTAYGSSSELQSLEKQLDDAIFDLYGLTQSERDLIEDMCSIGFELLYRSTSKNAFSGVDLELPKWRGTIQDLTVDADNTVSMQNYIHTFLQIWNRELEPTGEFSWNVIHAINAPMIAVIFTPKDKEDPLENNQNDIVSNWDHVLKRCSEALRRPISRYIYIEGMVRVATDTEIYIIKRNERRLWTRSKAREDAEATFLQIMNLEQRESF